MSKAEAYEERLIAKALLADTGMSVPQRFCLFYRLCRLAKRSPYASFRRALFWSL